MTTLRDIVFEDIRADYLDRRSGSVLYRFLKNGKLKKKCESEPEKEEVAIEKAAVDLMYNHGYPLSRKESKKGSRTSNTALDLMDSWYLERGKYCPAFASEDVNEAELQDLFDVLNREGRSRSLIPVKIDRLSGAGLYIMGKDLFPKYKFKYGKDTCCGFAIICWKTEISTVMKNGVKEKKEETSMKFDDIMSEDLAGCLNVKDALRMFNRSIMEGKDDASFSGMEDYLFGIHNTNGNMPENCPKSLMIYFADYGETDDFEISDEDLSRAREECEGL